jgi:hypothetical protein
MKIEKDIKIKNIEVEKRINLLFYRNAQKNLLREISKKRDIQCPNDYLNGLSDGITFIVHEFETIWAEKKKNRMGI